MSSKLTYAAWKDVPSTYVLFTEDKAIPPEMVRSWFRGPGVLRVVGNGVANGVGMKGREGGGKRVNGAVNGAAKGAANMREGKAHKRAKEGALRVFEVPGGHFAFLDEKNEGKIVKILEGAAARWVGSEEKWLGLTQLCFPVGCGTEWGRGCGEV